MTAMLKFAPSGVYVMCKYKHETQQAMLKWAKDNDIPYPLEGSKLHSTIVQSNASIPNYEDLNREDVNWEFTIKKMEMFETRFSSLSGKPEAGLVFMLDAPELKELHLDLRKRGANHSRPDYNPHVTVSYFVPKSINISKLPLPTFKMKVDKIVAEPIDVDWIYH